MLRRTITLIAKADRNVEDVVVRDVTNYKVGYKLIWIEYGNDSILAVKRSDFDKMTVTEETDIVIDSHDPMFERINCDAEVRM